MCQCLSRTVLNISALPSTGLTLCEGSQAADVEQVFPRLKCREMGSQRRRERREEGSTQGGDTWREGRREEPSRRKGKDWRQRKGTQEEGSPFSKNKPNLVPGCVRTLTGWEHLEPWSLSRLVYWNSTLTDFPDTNVHCCGVRSEMLKLLALRCLKGRNVSLPPSG